MGKRLIISASYRPLTTPRAFRWTALAEYWADRGMYVDVVSAMKPGLMSEETSEGVRIHRVGGTLVDRLRRNLKKPDPHVDKTLEQATAQSRGSSGLRPGSLVAAGASALHHGLWKHIWWPDSTCLWYFAVMRRAKQLFSEHRYNAIVTSSPSFTAHVAGYRLKKKYPAITWLVDIGDPFCFAEDAVPNNRRLYGNWNYAFERRVFRCADNVSVTTQQTADQYAALFPESAGKITVVPPLVPVTSVPDGAAAVFPEDSKLRLVFTGSLYRHIRRPDFLLDLFVRLLETPHGDRLELHFLGNSENCRESFAPYQHLLDNRIFVHGLVDHGRALQALEEADVLINISNNTRYQLPSKVVEYASTGKPIINLAQIENDSSAAMFSDYPSALSLLDADGSPTATQVGQVEAFLGNLPARLDVGTIESWTAPFRIDAIAARYDALLAGPSPSAAGSTPVDRT